MKPLKLLLFFAPLILAGFSGCKKQAEPSASQPAPQTSELTQPQAHNPIEAVNSALRAKNYAEVANALAPVLAQPNLTPLQKDTIRAAYRQINQAIAADPQLDTRELYELRAKLSKALTSGPRF